MVLKRVKVLTRFPMGTVTMEVLEMGKDMGSAPKRLIKAITPGSG
jgi:hypothetical protein